MPTGTSLTAPAWYWKATAYDGVETPLGNLPNHLTIIKEPELTRYIVRCFYASTETVDGDETYDGTTSQGEHRKNVRDYIASTLPTLLRFSGPPQLIRLALGDLEILDTHQAIGSLMQKATAPTDFEQGGPFTGLICNRIEIVDDVGLPCIGFEVEFIKPNKYSDLPS